MVAAALFLSACGGGGGNSQPPPPPVVPLVLSNVTNFTASTSYAIAGGGAFVLWADGSGFTSSSVLEWNGTPLSTTFGTGGILTATVSAALIAAPGTAQITVKDPSESQISNTLSFGVASQATATAGVMMLVSVAPDGSPANGDSLVSAAINSTGRYVAFQTNATNLVTGPASGFQEIYERDTCIGASTGCAPATIRITVTSDGSPVNFHSRFSAISADGRFVAFDSQATNILPGTDVCGGLSSCVFLRDTCIGAAGGCAPSTMLVSVTQSGTAVGGGAPTMSSNGRIVIFDSQSPDVVAGETSSLGDVFARDTCNGAPAGCSPSNTLVSLSSTGSMGNAPSNYPPATDTLGRYVAFQSNATNLAPNVTVVPGIFLRDTCIGASTGCAPATNRADVGSDGSQPNNGVFQVTPAISNSGRLVALASQATNLVAQNVAGLGNIYVHDTCEGTPVGACTPSTSLVSLANDGSVGNCGSPSQALSMTPDGRFVAFDSIATNLVPGDTFAACSFEDVFVRDTCFGASSGCLPSTVRVSVANAPFPQTPANSVSGQPAISADGHYLVFLSAATNLVAGGNGHSMVFLAKTGF